MEIVNLRVIEKFKKNYAGARGPLADWPAKTFIANWETPTDVRKIFSSASFVKNFVIFNIGDNKYRLLTEIIYPKKIVRILRAAPHDEYNGWKL